MNKKQQTITRTYMKENVADHIDFLTGEVNATHLAEDAAWHFGEGNQGEDIDEDYFDLADTIAEWYEVSTGIRRPNMSNISGLINSRSSDYF